MEGESARRRIEMISSHFSAADTISATRVFPLNCSGGLCSIKRRCDNSMFFARQDSKSQAPFMRPALIEQDFSSPSTLSHISTRLHKEGPDELVTPLFSRPARTNANVPKVRNLQHTVGIYELSSSHPPKFARITKERDLLMSFGPKNKTHACKRTDKEKKASPMTDVIESRGKYILLIELPGVSIEDIRVEADNTTLTVQTNDRTSSTYHKTGILKGPYETVWPLPLNANPDSISAEFVDGLLHITIPKLRVPFGDA